MTSNFRLCVQAPQGRGMTPEQRRLREQNAAHARWSRHMAREDQAYLARQAIWDRLSREVDPERKLTPRAVCTMILAQGRPAGLPGPVGPPSTPRRHHSGRPAPPPDPAGQSPA